MLMNSTLSHGSWIWHQNYNNFANEIIRLFICSFFGNDIRHFYYSCGKEKIMSFFYLYTLLSHAMLKRRNNTNDFIWINGSLRKKMRVLLFRNNDFKQNWN